MTTSVYEGSLIASAPLASRAQALRDGALELHALIDETCDRIKAVDGVVESLLPEPGRRERLHQAAHALLGRYPEPAQRPPLFGVLVGIKDIYHVDGFVTRAGTAVPPECFAGEQAQVVNELVAAGALILGKTVTTEFAYFEPGPTRNPHNPAHTPGGSSSGSAAAVAAGICPLAVGSQTIGSVIRPAAYCGIVGFKPSFDRIPTAGVVHYSPTLDHVGLFTQDVAGMALAASVLLTGWRADAADAAVSTQPAPVVAIPEGPYLAQAEGEALAAFAAQVGTLEAQGWRVKRIAMFADIGELNLMHRQLANAEFARGQAKSFAEHASLYRPRTVEAIQMGAAVADEALPALRAHCNELRIAIQSLMDGEGIDAWIMPAATGPAPLGIHATGDPNMNLPWTHAGMPAITVPAGQAANGLPLGLQLAARFGADEALLAWAAQVERVFAAG